MPILSPTELQALSALLTTELLTDTCVIQGNTPTKDPMGSTSDSWSTLSTVPCALIGPSAGQEVVIDERIGALAIWTVLFPNATVIAEGNRIVTSSHTLTVQADLTPETHAILMQVRASEVK